MQISAKYGVTPEDAETLFEALNEGAVNLLTGAGASYGARGGDGRDLGGGQELARELNGRFGLENVEPDCSDLQLVYGDVAAEKHLRPQLSEFLRNRFSKCSPTWQSKLLTFPWKQIWTLNIDDTLQRSVPTDYDRKIESYSWSDKLHIRNREGKELQIVHLHGRATHIDTSLTGIIFSLREYAARNEISPGWHAEFRSEFVKKPFIICGTRLKDEFDLATVLEFGNHSRGRGGCPSFIVLRDFAPGEQARFRRQGLVPIQASGKDFFETLEVDLSKWRATKPQVTPIQQSATLEVRAKFRQLSPTDIRPKKSLDFYSSAETQWHHIIDDLDARLTDITKATTWLREPAIDARVCLITGGPVCGKTTSALRVAFDLMATGYEVLLFRSEERFDETAVIDYLTAAKNVVLVFDDCADFSKSISSLISIANDESKRIRVVATAELKRIRGVKIDLSPSNIRLLELEPLRNEYFLSIYAKRKQKGRLGRCTDLDTHPAWIEFRDQFNWKLLEWLESLEGALPLKAALNEILDIGAQQGSTTRRLVMACASTHRFGYSLPFVLSTSFKSNLEIEELLESPSALSQIAYLDDKGVRLRSTSFAYHVWTQAERREKYEITLSLAKQLAPLVVSQSIARRTYPHRILREIMSNDVVAADLGDLAENWYAELLPLMGWNSRYWEQRALLAIKKKHDDLAYSYAKKAVSILGHQSFSHNTLGTICMRISVRRKDDFGLARFWEGVSELETARQLAIDDLTEWEHPYVTFFTYALLAYRIFTVEVERISQAWNRWMKSAEQSKLFNFDDEGQMQLRSFQHEWLSLAIPD